ncbi:MAG: copper resistance protein CopC [Terriglobia bacterium]
MRIHRSSTGKVRILRRGVSKTVLLAVVALTVFFYSTSRLGAHAIIVEATPSANEIVTGPELQVALKFNSRIDGARSRMTLVAPDHSTRPLSLDKQDSPTKSKRSWVACSQRSVCVAVAGIAADGHISRGEIPFKVK